MLNRSGDRPNLYPEGEEAEMKPSRRYQERQARVPNSLQLTSKPTGVSQPRQSPTTDIRSLTRLVFEAYQHTYPASSPKVRARYRKLIEELSRKGITDGVA
jgi:hypothetical protein